MKYETFIKARKSGEKSLWVAADALVEDWARKGTRNELVPTDYDCTQAPDVDQHAGNGCCIWQAQVDEGIAPWSFQTARANRLVAEVFTPQTRAYGVSFSAHRMALRNSKANDTVGVKRRAGLNAIQTVLNDPAVNGNAALVSENRVRAVIGKGSKAKATHRAFSLKSLTEALGTVTVNSHLAEASDKALAEYCDALRSALSKAEAHAETRKRRAAKSAKKTKSASSGAPAQARG